MHIWAAFIVGCIYPYRVNKKVAMGDATVSSYINTLTQRQTDPILQTTSSNAFSWMKMYDLLLKLHWRLFLRVSLTLFQHWFIGADHVTRHYLNQWCLVYWCIYASQWGRDKMAAKSKILILMKNVQHVYIHTYIVHTRIYAILDTMYLKTICRYLKTICFKFIQYFTANLVFTVTMMVLCQHWFM